MKELIEEKSIPVTDTGPYAKLTEDDVKMIRHRRACGVPLTKIHEEYDFVSYSAIRNVCRGHVWRNVS